MTQKKSIMELAIVSQFDDKTTFNWAVRYRFYGEVVTTEPQPTMEAAMERLMEIYQEHNY